MAKHLPKSENKHLKETDLSYLNQPLREEKTAHSQDALSALSKLNLALTAISLLLLVSGGLVPGKKLISTVLFLLAFAAAGVPIFIRAVEKIFALKLLEEDVEVSLAGILLLSTAHFGAAAAAMSLYSVSRLIWAYAEKRKKDLWSGIKIALPEEVKLETEHGLVSCPPQKLAEDDIFRVDVGETIAADGVVLEGISSLDASALCGNYKDVAVGVGSVVLSGCVNMAAPLRIKVSRIFEDSTAARITALLDNSKKYKSLQEKLLSRISRISAPALSLAALLLGLIPPLIGGKWRQWLGCAAVLLFLSGSSSLEQAVDLSYCSAVIRCVKKGIIIKGRRFIEDLARSKTMIFNKTGTITDGRYSMIDIAPQNMSEEQLLAIAAAAEQFSSHPIAAAICRADGGYEKQDGDKSRWQEIPGRGVIAWLGNKHVFVGNAAHLEENGVSCAIARKGGAAIHVAIDGKYCGYLLVSDKVKDGAFDAIEALRHRGVKSTVLLTSDSRSVARPIASALNFEMVKAELSEDGKISAVEYLLATKAEHTCLSFVGNRADDAEAFSRADVGISVNALGSAAALETADILVMSSDLRYVAEAMKLSQQACILSAINFLLSCGVKVVLVLLAISGLVSPAAAVCIDFASAVACYINVFRYELSKSIKNNQKIKRKGFNL